MGRIEERGTGTPWARLMPLATVALLGLLIFGLSLSGLPLPNRDAPNFMQFSINQAGGRGLINRYFTMDFSGGQRLVWHGWLVEMLYAVLLWRSDYAALFILKAIVAIAALLGSALLFVRVLARSQSDDVLPGSVFASLLLVGLVPALLSWRPEPFVTLLIALTAIALPNTPVAYRWLIWGVSLGFIGAAHPAAGVLSALGCGIYFSWILDWRRAILAMAASAGTAAGSLLLATVLFYPYRLYEWFYGLYWHAKHLGPAPGSMVDHWFLEWERFGYGGWYLGALVLSCWAAWRRRRAIGFPVGVVVFAGLAAAFAWLTAVWVSARNYNLVLFAPLVCLMLLEGYVSLATSGSSNRPNVAWRRATARAAICLVGVAPSAATVLMVASIAASADCALSYRDAREIVGALQRAHRGIAMTSDLFVLADDDSKIELLSFDETPSTQAAVLVVQQAHSGRLVPPAVSGFRLVNDKFSHTSPSLFGWRIGRTPVGYNLAVYVRDGGRLGCR